MAPAFEILSREALEDPHSVQSRLRDLAPVCQVEHGWWAVSRHRDVVHVLKHPELFSSAGIRTGRDAAIDERLRGDQVFPESASIIANDPPVHTRLRKLIAGAFTPAAMSRLEPRVRALTVGLLDRILELPVFDVVADLAIPLPVIVIAERIGVDPSRLHDFKRWSDAVVDVVAPRSDSDVERVLAARRELRAYIEELIVSRRMSPGDDLVSDLCRAEGAEGVVSTDEVLSLVVTLLVAGNITTTNLISSAALVLAERPDVFSTIRRDPAVIPAFIEEVLRFDGPAKMLLRRATREVELSGVVIPEGAIVAALLAAANRDPEVFPEPDVFDVRRNTRSHVSFGFGIHFCVGAALSRLEGRVVFEEIARRLPPFSREPEPLAWIHALGLRGLAKLLVQFDRRLAA